MLNESIGLFCTLDQERKAISLTNNLLQNSIFWITGTRGSGTYSDVPPQELGVIDPFFDFLIAQVVLR